jgi:hypothetical protein
MIVRITTTGQIGSVVRGPYRKYGRDWYDVVTRNDFGEPGRYSRAYPVDQCEPIE